MPGAAGHIRISSPYRDLKVRQRSIDLTENIYRITALFPTSEVYGLSAQMRRAAVSIASNIAEGWGRRSRKDYGRFVVIALGSNDELRTQIIIAGRLGFGEASQLSDADNLCDEIGRMLSGLYAFLQTPCRKPRT